VAIPSATSIRDLTDVVTRLRRALRRSIRSDFPWEALPMSQVEVLQSLDDSGPIRVSDLAERLRLAQSTVSGIVGTLLAEKLVSRRVDATDRRASVVSLTAAGRRGVQDWDAAHRRRLAAALRSLSRSDRVAILAAVPALRRLVDTLDSDAG
jgi:DNA-binding MarR family transcriptional regulator